MRHFDNEDNHHLQEQLRSLLFVWTNVGQTSVEVGRRKLRPVKLVALGELWVIFITRKGLFGTIYCASEISCVILFEKPETQDPVLHKS